MYSPRRHIVHYLLKQNAKCSLSTHFASVLWIHSISYNISTRGPHERHRLLLAITEQGWLETRLHSAIVAGARSFYRPLSFHRKLTATGFFFLQDLSWVGKRMKKQKQILLSDGRVFSSVSTLRYLLMWESSLVVFAKMLMLIRLDDGQSPSFRFD